MGTPASQATPERDQAPSGSLNCNTLRYVLSAAPVSNLPGKTEARACASALLISQASGTSRIGGLSLGPVDTLDR